MAMYAELFDGTRLEFPDGTDPSVIQGTAKKLTLERQTPAEKPAPVQQPADSSPILGSIEKGIVGAKQSVKQAQLASLMDLQAADKEKYGETYQGAPSDQLDRISARDKAIQDKLQEVAQYGVERKEIEAKRGVNPLSKEVSNIRNTEAYKNADTLDQLKMYGNALWSKKADIPGYIAGVGLESLPSSLPTIAAAMAARFSGMGPTGAAIAGGAGSSFTEFGNQYAELRAEGLDHKEAWEKAGVKSGVIGLFDAASFKSAGGAASNIMRNIEKGAIKQTVKETGKEIGTQALYGMAGEGLGSVAINQKVDPISVIEEGLGEVVGAPLEAATTYRKNVAEAKAGQPAPTTKTAEAPAPELTPGAPIPTTQQGTLFAPEELPASTATLTPDVLTAQTEAGKPVETEALQAPERAQAEIERNIFALQQQEQTPQIQEQIAALQEQLPKGPGETLDVLKQEYTTLGNKGVAIQTQIQELTAQRDATPGLDAKLAITEQLKPLEAQLETIVGRQQELLQEGSVLAKQVTPTETVEAAPELNLQGTITEDDFKTMKINKSNVKLREAILGKDLSDPAQRQEVIDVLNDYASSPNRSAAMSTRIGDFINSISQEAQNDERTGAGAVNGAAKRGIPVPSAGVQTAKGIAAPQATRVGSAIGPVARVDGGAGVSGEAGDVALSQAATPAATPLAPVDAAQKAAKNSAGFNAGNKPLPKATFFRNLADKLRAVREGNLNVGSLVFGNLQNFAANNQAFLNLMRKTALGKIAEGSLTKEQAEGAMLGLIGAQVSQRGQLSVQMMDNGNWAYDADTNTYVAIPDADNMSVFGDLIKQLATRLGVSPETAHTYMDQAIEANRLQGVLDNLDTAKGNLTRTLKRIEFLKNDIQRQRTPKGTKTAAEQRAFDKAENARVTKAKDELKLKEALAAKLKDDISLYTDQAMHKDRSNIREGMELLNDHPEIQEGVRVWNVMRQRTIDFMVGQGLLTEEKAQKWMDEAAYVPFFRDVEATTEEAQQVMTKGLRETMAPLRAKYKGSMLDVASVTGNMRSWMQWALAGAISNGQINRMLGVYQNWLPEEVKEGRGNANNTFTVMQGGVERHYHVAQPEIAQAFMQQAAYIFPLMKMAKTVSDIGRKSITRNPAFSLVQIPMDLYAAMFTSGIRNPGELVAQIFKESVLTVANASKTRKDLISKGLLNTHEYNALTAEDAIKYAQDIVPPSYYRQAMNALDRFGSFSDNVVRQAVRSQLIREGHSEQTADTAVAEIMNFRNKSGVKAFNSLSASVLFFNSWLQQVAITLKTLSGKGITFQTRKEGLATLAIVSGKIFAFSFLLSALSDAVDDEDEYARRSRMAKNRIFNIPGTEGMGIPIREDLYALPKIFADYAYRYVAKDAKDRGVDMKSLKESLRTVFKNTVTPPGEGVPQLIKPTAEAALNVDIHTGRQIVPEHMKNLEPGLQFNATTSEFAKWVGDKTNISPLHLDHLMKGYFGTTAQLMDMATGAVIANVRDIPKPTESTRATLGKLPSIGIAFGKEDNQAIAGDFYEVKKDFDRSIESYKKMALTDPEAAEKYRKEHEDTMFKASKMGKRLEVLKRRENIIRNLPSKEKNPEIGMTADEKAAAIKQINDIRAGFAPVVQQFREKAYK